MSETKFTGLNFNAAEVKPDAGREPIPAGWYNAVVTDSEVKPTKDGTGLRANIGFKVLDGQYANRMVFNGYNVKNASAKAEEIGRGQFSALCHAVGVLNVQSTTQLHGIPLKIKVKIVPEQAGYDAKNEVTICKNINEVAEGSTVASGPAMPKMPEMPAAFNPAAQAKQPWTQPAAQEAPAQPAWAQKMPTQPAETVARAAEPVTQPLPPEAQAAQQAVPAWVTA